MPLFRKPATVAISACFALSALVLSSPPATGAESGKGSAIIRIDATKATVAKKAEGTYTLHIPAGSAGQWMGERTNSRGEERLRVGNLTAKQLSSRWKDFRYSSSGVKTTITWDSGQERPSMAPGRLTQPKVSANGITFGFTTDRTLPFSMTGVTINLQRAPGKSMRTDYDPEGRVDLSGDLKFMSGYYGDPQSVDQRLFNSTNDNTCWSHTFYNVGKTEGMPDGTCSNVEYSEGSTAWYYADAWETDTAVSLTITLKPADEAKFVYSSVIVTAAADW